MSVCPDTYLGTANWIVIDLWQAIRGQQTDIERVSTILSRASCWARLATGRGEGS
jgi:hypothetical protein